MKIGILTYHSAHNYGAVLQAYATRQYLHLQGHEVYMIDYRPEAITKRYELSSKRFFRKNPIKILNELKISQAKKIKYDKYVNFIDLLNLSKPVNQIPSNLDAYIIGSDQVWNPKITKRFEPFYFADFNFPKGEKKYISYAASAETKALTNDEIEFYKKNLQNFDSLSVREEELKTLLAPLTSQEITQVLDPTLLLEKQEWDKVAKTPNEKEKYVLVYEVRKDPRTLEFAKNIAEQLGAKVVQLATDVTINNYKDATVDAKAGAEEYVGWIKNAACVVTSSFHGTAFSVIYQKDFYSIALEDGKNTRVSSLLSKISLDHRIIPVGEKVQFEKIDYEQSSKDLKVEVKNSQDFLLKSLNP